MLPDIHRERQMASGGILSPALRTKQSLLRVSSVVVAVTPGKARTRFSGKRSVFTGYCIRFWRRSVPYMTV